MKYDRLCLLFRRAGQACDRVGRSLRRVHHKPAPVCERESIIGHSRRRKQAHDEYHDWIWIHRGRCAERGTTFAFLPVLSLPCMHDSLLARCLALLRSFVKHCPWDKALTKQKDPDRLSDPSTLRRSSSGLDYSQPALSFLSPTVARVAYLLAPSHRADGETAPLLWITPVLEKLWPLRL